MTEEPISLVEFLRRFDARLERMEDDLQELKLRVGNLEAGVAHLGVVIAQHSNRFDRIEGRLARIEQRLDLVDAG
jgi:multidrug resistance efflux pump